MSIPLADPSDMDLVVSKGALAKIVTETRKKFLSAASDEAYAELDRVCTLPLTVWSDDIRSKVATIATYEAMAAQGFDSADQGSSLLRRAEAARKWFKDLQSKPPGVVDSSVEPEQDGPAMVTSPRRDSFL